MNTITGDGTTLTLDIKEDFEGGVAIVAAALRVALNRIVNRGDATAAWAADFIEEVGNIVDESLEGANIVYTEETDVDA